MAGHSKFKNIQHRKGAQDKKRGKIFTKLVREIVTAAKIGGTDSKNNPRLRASLVSARSQNLPKDKIDKALSIASDDSNEINYTEIQYEGFLSDGIAFIIESLTDNKNRTASEVRSIFSRYGGNLGESGSTSFMFNRLGKITYDIDDENLIEVAIEYGASDVELKDGSTIIYTDIQDFTSCLDMLTQKSFTPHESGIEWIAQNIIIIDDYDKASKIIKFINALEESDDIQNIFGNYKFSKEVMSRLSVE